VATKEHKRQVKGLIEGLESRVHVGPPIHAEELVSLRNFLNHSEFSPASDYYSRLTQIQERLQTRSTEPGLAPTKRNYGGEAAGRWMQLQLAYDHIILSTCYEGEFNLKRGRIKISHRFNQEGRIEFVELKFLRSLQPFLNGAIRKLLTIKSYQSIRRDWRSAEAFVLEVLPRELVFLYENIFRSEKNELFAWLINIGHGLLDDLLKDLQRHSPDGLRVRRSGDQLCLSALRTDEVAYPILERAAMLHSVVEILDPKRLLVRYPGGNPS